MNPYTEIFFPIIASYLICCLSNLMFQKKWMILLLIISLTIFIIGLIIKNNFPSIDYRFFLFPFIEIALLSFYHILFNLTSTTPFYLNMRGFGYPDHLKTDKNGFEQMISGVLSNSLPFIMLFIFWML